MGELLGAEQDDHRREEEHPDHRPPPLGGGELAHRLGRAHQVGFLGRGPGDPDHVEHEDADQDGGVDQGDRALEREGERVDGGDRQERELDGVGALELDAVHPLAPGLEAPPGDEDHHRPAEPDEQPVGAGHVGQGQRAVRLPLADELRRLADSAELLECLPALEGEDQVDGVLRQHGDEGEDGDGQAGGDIELGHLGRPRQEERRPHDGQPEDQRQQRIGQVDVDPGDDRPRKGHGRRDRHERVLMPAAGGGRGGLGHGLASYGRYAARPRERP